MLAARRLPLAAVAARSWGACGRTTAPPIVRRWLTTTPTILDKRATGEQSTKRASLADGGIRKRSGLDARMKSSSVRWNEIVLPALETFYRINGHSLVPARFIVPSAQPWPTDAWGVQLGMAVNLMRTKGVNAALATRDANRLLAIEFVWDVGQYKWESKILPALEAFAEKHGHCDVPSTFEVPSDSAWPSKAWGFKLGSCVRNIRSNGNYPAETKRDAARLDAIGFRWDVMEHRWSSIILPALETFFAESSHCRVPLSYIVPSSSPWPKEAWGFRLGRSMKYIRSLGGFAAMVKRDAARLAAIGFVPNSAKHKHQAVASQDDGPDPHGGQRE